jgi:signal transduction histidine kinase
MSLRAFIRDHHTEIIGEFAVFARTLMPPGAGMTERELRDHAEDILIAVVKDMATFQTGQEQSEKSQGRGAVRSMEWSGRLHADDRIQHGFSFRSVLAEFRALRASVLRLYAASGDSDVTEVPRFNEAIDEALTESMERFAARTDAFRDQFIGILSHDLRTPLGAITTAAALLAAPVDNPERRTRVVTRIMTSASRMERMVADLLELTRARLGGAMPLNRRSTDLGSLCAEVIGELRAGRPHAVVELTARGDVSGDWDPDRLSQVVSNLIGNAIQHGDGSSIGVTVTGDEEAVTLAVHNGGDPIPPDVLPAIFDPLTRVSGTHESRGIGLGLFIARTIVCAHQGDLGVTSSSEHGTTFTARLPRRGPTERTADQASKRSDHPASSPT